MTLLDPWRDSTTRSFDSWFYRERELRAFMRFGVRFADEGMQRIWTEIERRPSDGSLETIDVFDREMDGLGLLEFEWILRASTIKDGVTLYEVYLEQAFDEVLLAHGLERKSSDESPRWPELRVFYRLLGVDLYSDDAVADARRLRHVLTHRRGAISRDSDRERFGSDYPFPVETVELTEASTLAAMDALATSVNAIEPIACRYSWGRERVSELIAMREETGHDADASLPSVPPDTAVEATEDNSDASG